MKTIVLIGIAVCAMLLTSPVLANAGYSKIYGNANEDDVLDMRDVTYIKLVIFGKKPATDFADANYDGKISMLDVGQTKLIILGKEKKLTLLDQVDRAVTVPRPIERIALVGMLNSLRTLVQLGAADKIVVTSTVVRSIYDEPGKSKYFSPLHRAAPELEGLPRVDYRDPSLEVILTLEPDVILSYGAYSNPDKIQDGTGIPTVCSSKSTGGDLSFEQHRLIGTVVGKEERAEELISYVNEKLDELRDVTSEIPKDEKPKVYLAHRPGATGLNKGMCRYDPIEIAGGINVFGEDCIGASVEVSKEQIIKWNPDIILMGSNPSKVHPLSIEDVLSDPVLQTINAVKNKKVYYTKGCMIGWDPATVTTEAFYFAKLFHPDEFEDLDVEEECNEILERFYGVDGLYTEMAEKCDFYRWE
ncbi:hypothetical protein CW713_07210 [Methanophagales archaeon]|nr:MAG: hypothetical protein CW713_07210 [Methanophagales archaeon]